MANLTRVTDYFVKWKSALSGAVERLLHDRLDADLYIMDFGAKGDGVTDDTAIFALMGTNHAGRVINLERRTYKVTTLPTNVTFVNGYIIANSLDTGLPVTLFAPRTPNSISSMSDTGEFEARYLNPLTGDYQPSGRSTTDLYGLFCAQNSRSLGPARAVNIATIYSVAAGNISGNIISRQARATVPQSANFASEDCRVEVGFRGVNLASITSQVTGETGVNIGSRRGWCTGYHTANIASVDAHAGGGYGAKFKVTVNSNGTIASVAIVSAGQGYSANGTLTFYDRLSAPSTLAAATYTIDSNGSVTSVTITNAGVGYSTTTDPTGIYEVVQANLLEAGNYSANVATANNCVTYGEVSFNLGANNCAAKANRSGNIAANGASTAALYAVNIGTNVASNSGAQSAIIGGGGNTITAGSDGSVIIGGNNSGATFAGCFVYGRRVAPRQIRSAVFGDGSSGTYSTANIKQEFLPNGNVNIAGVLTQSVTFTDIAKMFENKSEGEIPVGHLVTLDGRKVRKAVEGDDDLLSAVSGTYVQLLGDSTFTWSGRYLRNDLGEIQYQDVWDAELKQLVKEPIDNPDFDPSQEQVPRSERKDEWSAVAMLGEVHVYVDSTVTENSYVKGGSLAGVGTVASGKTTMRCMEIRKEYDASLGYAIALCLVHI